MTIHERMCADLIEAVRVVLADREALAAEIRERGARDKTQWGPGGERLLTRRVGARLTWFAVQPVTIWYAEGYVNDPRAESWSVERTPDLTDRLALAIGRLACCRAVAPILELAWSDAVRQAASEPTERSAR